MKLVEKVKIDKRQTMFIYQLSKEQSKRSEGGYIVSQKEYTDYGIKRYGELHIVSELREHCYEGIFQTQKEAYFHSKLVVMKHQLDYVRTHFKDVHITEINW